MDNVQTAPVIPMGTEKTVYGANSFANLNTPQYQSGQAANTPVGQPAVQVPQQPSVYDELAAKAGFKSPDDLAKSYMELQRQATKVEMSFAELSKAREEALKPQQVVPEPMQVQAQTPDEAIKIVNSMIAAQTRPLQDKLELQDLYAAHPDAKDYSIEMAEIIKSKPYLSWIDTYRLAKFNKFDAVEKQAAERGRQEAYQTIQQKQAASVGSAGRGSTHQETNLMDIVRDRSIPMSEVRNILIEKLA